MQLFEMRPNKNTPIHKTGNLAELVCSNSLGSDRPNAAPGILKAELRKLGSLIMEAADNASVRAGQALAVDREEFSQYIQEKIQSNPDIELIREEINEIPAGEAVVIATGPLTSESMAESLKRFLGEDFLFFYDAVSPVITAESIDMGKTFPANRYGRGTPDYLNCSMSREEYDRFYDALTTAERVNPHDFEKDCFFEGCMPIEEMADRGRETLLFGPLKPVGLDDDAAGVVQLRREDSLGILFNLVGFQTRLKWSEQKRVIRMIPGLEYAEFVRYGVMHKNIYMDSPRVLAPTLNLKKDERIFMAGQITGVEGYMESTATGLMAGINASRKLLGKSLITPPAESALGALISYITDEERKNFQPMNTNFGILPPLNVSGGKKARRLAKVERAQAAMDCWIKENMLDKGE